MSKHDPRVRERCRELYEQAGAAYAAEHTGTPERTNRRWAAEEGWTRRLAGLPAQAVAEGERQRAAVLQGWSTRRRRAADRFGQVAMKALDRLDLELDRRRPFNLQGLTMAAVTLAGKAEELSAATGGGGDYADMPAEAKVARLVELVDVVTERVGAGDGES
jgi:hypothetical protein